jgi:hypothetical protein
MSSDHDAWASEQLVRQAVVPPTATLRGTESIRRTPIRRESPPERRIGVLSGATPGRDS